MADKPIYYGSSNSSPIYYGSHKPIYGSQRSPVYYGSTRYYGQYGGTGAPEMPDGGSAFGALTLSRIIRVIGQRWLSIFVFFLVGIIVSFAVYSISPRIYEAVSEFTIDIRRNTGKVASAIEQAMPDFGSNYAEIFNTRLSQWRSEAVIKKVIENYQRKYDKSKVTDQELIETLATSKLELVRNSRIIKIAIRSKDPETAMALANAYVSAIVATTQDENKIRCDKAVSQIHEQVEKSRREKDFKSDELLKFKTDKKVDTLHSQRDTIQQLLQKATTDIANLETVETELVEWEKLLTRVKAEPDSFGSLASGAQRSQDIQSEYSAFQKALEAHSALKAHYTDDHPEVQAASNACEYAKKRFLDAVARAHDAGIAALGVARNQLAALRAKQQQLRTDLASVSEKIAVIESTISTLEAEINIANHVFQQLILEEQKARQEADSNNEIVNENQLATLPNEPVLPNTLVIFGAGIFISIFLGVVFVLVVDNLEDTIVNLSDIEERLALKVLALLPHVRRKKREQVAKYCIEERHSQFAEAVAGLRNLLNSPRYEAMSHCILVISTQPGEGKTITSTSIAISYAQAGRKVLHVDFDLRRPRLATVWDVNLDVSRSFSHVLQGAMGKKPDFAALVNKTSLETLDVICSLPPEGVTPATIFGSGVVAEFFKWARANYDHVVIDAPPFGIVGDVVSLAVQADSVLIMCCPSRTHFKPIQFCSRSLTEAGANILGVIVNDIDVSLSSSFTGGRSGGYGYGYGYSSRYGYHYGGVDEGDGSGDGDNPVEEGSARNRQPTEQEAELTDED